MTAHPRTRPAIRKDAGAIRVLEAAADIARRRGKTALTLTTFADVPWNGPLYRRLGFEELDEGALSGPLAATRARETAAGPDAEPRIAMRRAL